MQEATSARRAEEFQAQGFMNARALLGGYQGWQDAVEAEKRGTVRS